MKIAVYAIAKNEEKHVKRFCESAKEADLIVIADTGSEDKTVEIAKECGVQVHQINITPFRFDVARNAALSLVPADVDICVSMDLDELLLPGWRKELEQCWSEDITRLNIGFDFGENRVFYPSRAHNRHGYYWKYPCHEYITPDTRMKDVCGHTAFVMMTHKPDDTKSRGQYLELLEMAVKEDPNCHRSCYYYAREMTFKFKWEEAIVELKRYLTLPTAVWPLERSHTMRMIGASLEKMQQPGIAWFRKAVAEEPTIRENWFDLAMLCYEKQRWAECYGAGKTAIEITDNIAQHTCAPQAWGFMLPDVIAIAAYHLKFKEDAIKYGQMALDMNPTDGRLKTNLKFYKEL
jgi:glycosyltransferase involved in cell wall biosynthesis